MEKLYRVIREHEGDKSYRVNDPRMADPREVAHLVGKCLVEATEEETAAYLAMVAAEAEGADTVAGGEVPAADPKAAKRK